MYASRIKHIPATANVEKTAGSITFLRKAEILRPAVDFR
jgi:hypothetical protein